ncbi:MAG: hypothetical protein RIG62_14690, partial [Cyclobacteriaceae bacterium]
LVSARFAAKFLPEGTSGMHFSILPYLFAPKLWLTHDYKKATSPDGYLIADTHHKILFASLLVIPIPE